MVGIADKRRLFCSLLFCCAGIVFSQDAQPTGALLPEKKTGADMHEKRIYVQGRVRHVGNMPFTEIVITDDNENDWYISNSEKNILEKTSSARITVEGTAYINDIYLADGRYAGLRRRLENIKLIN
ncbi:MAG: hypothetical protein LBD20_09525 [Spirochaetaceae bacterium]|jgi:hypothetical protein|nr:hypothetical protein [Spirochaetaceae bacterium]